MQGWVLQSEDTMLPEWLTSNLKAKCECGGAMENYYNEAGKITSRRCNNSNCPHRMAQKVVGMCNILGIKGVGPATAFNIIKEHNLSHHVDALPYITSEKPKVDLYTLLRLILVQGIDKGWSIVTEKCKSVDDLFTKYSGQYSDILQDNELYIRKCEGYVDLIRPGHLKYKPMLSGLIMIHGNLRGYDKREYFLPALNKMFDGLIDYRESGLRKTGITALIQEADSTDCRKANVAVECGIPIMTPTEFTEYVVNRLAAELEKREPELAEDGD